MNEQKKKITKKLTETVNFYSWGVAVYKALDTATPTAGGEVEALS
jgi:hypothetical protein